MCLINARIGRVTDSPGVGIIDEIRIWNRALDEDEIRTEMDIVIEAAVNPCGKSSATWGNIKRMYEFGTW
jgi:hypothetical protein